MENSLGLNLGAFQKVEDPNADRPYAQTQRGVLGDIGSLAGRSAIAFGETFEQAMEAWGWNDVDKDTIGSLRKYDLFKPDIDGGGR